MTNNDQYGFRFREWDIYDDARKFRKKINEVLKKYPKNEMYALVDQTKRALDSIILNIAEGSSKNSDKDTRLYVNRAHGSLDEVVACLDGALDDGYITADSHASSLTEVASLAKRLQGFNNYLSSKIRDQRSRGGFTILEIIIYILIFAIVGTLGTSVLSFALKAKNANSRLNEVAINMGRALSQMVEKVHQSLTINGASSSLNLAMSSSTLNPTVFSLSSGAITITEGASVAVSTTPSTIIITSLSFTQITNPAPSTSSVQIQMTGAYNNLGSADTSTIYSLQTTAMPL